MNTLKDIQWRLLSVYSWAVNDYKNQEQYKEYKAVNRVSRQIQYYKTHFFN